MKPISAWIASSVAAVGFYFAAGSRNLFEQSNAPTLYGIVIASFVVSYFIAVAWSHLPWRWPIPVVLGTLAGDRAGMVRDLGKDSTSHMMWPAELLLLAAAVSVCAFAGAFTGAHLAVKARKRVATSQPSL